jgi:hypothetical protein
MGLLIKLQSGDTQFKSLKFGKDRPDGGSSNQPYFQSPITANVNNSSFYNDFILRGGIKAPLRAAEDSLRLTKYFTDTKNPNGLLFIAKQNLLSRVGTKTEASKGLGYIGGALNEGAYTPLSTIGQALIGFSGGHLNKQGLDPTGLFDSANIVPYLKAIQQNQFSGTTFIPDNNRLIRLIDLISNNKAESNFAFIQGYNLNAQNSLISYQGGSNSVLGIGKTRINYATDNFGVPIKTLTNKLGNYKIPYKNEVEKWKLPFGTTTDYNNLFPQAIPTTSSEAFTTYVTDGIDSYQYNISQPYQISQITQFGEEQQTNLPSQSFTTKQKIADYTSPISKEFVSKGYNSPNFDQFKETDGLNHIYVTNRPTYKNPIIPFGEEQQTNLPSQSFTTKQKIAEYSSPISTILINKRYKPEDIENLEATDGKNHIDVTNNTSSSIKPSDLINNIPNQQAKNSTGKRIIYHKETDPKSPTNYSKETIDTTSLIPLKFTIINPVSVLDVGPSSSMDFTAYLDNLSDSYTADWSSQAYMGRGEKFYKYNTFGREINLAFTVVADNPADQVTNFEKLNRFAASLAPTYSTAGYLAGNLHRVTVGKYISGQYGIITGFTYDVMEESPWDLTSQLPFYIKVTGVKFTPIHNFRPESAFYHTHQYIKQ